MHPGFKGIALQYKMQYDRWNMIHNYNYRKNVSYKENILI